MSSVMILTAACLAIAAALVLVTQLIAYLVDGTFNVWLSIGAASLFALCTYPLYGDLWRARRESRDRRGPP